ncbi:unnamed protein product, partial [Symbiodinium microadriaticum]
VFDFLTLACARVPLAGPEQAEEPAWGTSVVAGESLPSFAAYKAVVGELRRGQLNEETAGLGPSFEVVAQAVRLGEWVATDSGESVGALVIDLPAAFSAALSAPRLTAFGGIPFLLEDPGLFPLAADVLAQTQEWAAEALGAQRSYQTAVEDAAPRRPKRHTVASLAQDQANLQALVRGLASPISSLLPGAGSNSLAQGPAADYPPGLGPPLLIDLEGQLADTIGGGEPLLDAPSATSVRGAAGRQKLQQELQATPNLFSKKIRENACRRMDPSGLVAPDCPTMIRYLDKVRDFWQAEELSPDRLDDCPGRRPACPRGDRSHGIALLQLVVDQANLDGGDFSFAWVLGLQPDLPTGVYQDVAGSAGPASRAFSPLAEQKSVTVALSYMKEIEAITARRAELHPPRRPAPPNLPQPTDPPKAPPKTTEQECLTKKQARAVVWAAKRTVLQFLQAAGLDTDCYFGKSGSTSGVPEFSEGLVPHLPGGPEELSPYRDLDAERIVLSGTGSWPLAEHLGPDMLLLYLEPRALRSFVPPPAPGPSFEHERKEQVLALSKKWDSLGLLGLTPGPLPSSCLTRIFGAFKDSGKDRQIGDRRNMNSQEARIDNGPSSRLPPGSLLTRLVCPRGSHALFGSIVDRRDFYRQALVSSSRAQSNAVGPVFSQAFTDYLAQADAQIRLASRALSVFSPSSVLAASPCKVHGTFKSLLQGDHAGVEFACAGHEGLLRSWGVLGDPPQGRLLNRCPVSCSGPWSGLIIDDLFCLSCEDSPDLLSGGGNGVAQSEELLRRAKAAYQAEGVPGSDQKDQFGQRVCTVAGAQIDSSRETNAAGLTLVGLPAARRLALAQASLVVASGRWISEELASQDLVLLAALSPIMVSNVSAPFSPWVSCSDASTGSVWGRLWTSLPPPFSACATLAALSGSILFMLQEGRLKSLLVVPPVGSFSPAWKPRLRAGDPPILRVPSSRTRRENAILSAAISALLVATRCNALAMVLHPLQSFARGTAPWRNLCLHRGAVEATLCACDAFSTTPQPAVVLVAAPCARAFAPLISSLTAEPGSSTVGAFASALSEFVCARPVAPASSGWLRLSLLYFQLRFGASCGSLVRQKLLGAFNAWLGGSGFTLEGLLLARFLDADVVSSWLVSYGRQLYEAGRPYWRYSETINGVAAMKPSLKRSLQGAWDLAFSWMAKEPSTHHLAMPPVILLSMLCTCLYWGWLREAGIFALSWGGLLRIGEATSALRSDLILSADVLHLQRHALIRIEEPKTRMRMARHQSAKIEQSDLVELLHLAFADLEASNRLWAQSPQMLRRRFDWVLERIGLPSARTGKKQLDLGSFRPGGATFLLSQTEDSELVRRRGRWASQRVMEIYIQEVQASVYFPSLPVELRQRIMDLAQCFAPVLAQATAWKKVGIPPSSWFALFSAGERPYTGL